MPDRIEVTYNLSTIAFTKFGEGSACLLAFHGFGEAGSSFLQVAASLEKKFTVYAMDLPFHGSTIWKENHPFSKKDLAAIIQLLLEQASIQRFSLMGFSMGGKCAMALCKVFPDKIDSLFLLASDGIRTRKIYNVAVYPTWGRQLFKSIIDRPGWFFSFIRIMKRMHLLSPWLLKFTVNHMDTREKRQRLYDTWVSMADFQINIRLLQTALNEAHIKVYLIFGKRDEVIPPRVAYLLAGGLHDAHVEIIERGHYFLDSRLNEVLEKQLAI